MAERVWLAERSQPGDGFPIHHRLMKTPSGILKGPVRSIARQAAARPAPAAEAGTVAPPNVNVIPIDGAGHGESGCYGAGPGWVRTPKIERLAREGIRFAEGNSTDIP